MRRMDPMAKFICVQAMLGRREMSNSDLLPKKRSRTFLEVAGVIRREHTIHEGYKVFQIFKVII
jgi:hypothetical protein